MEVKLGSRSLPATELFGLLTAVLVIIGSTLPWARMWAVGFVGDDIDIIYVNGVVGDGLVTLGLGILATVLILWRLFRRRSSTFSTIVLSATIVILVIAGLVGVFNWSELDQISGADLGEKYLRYGFQPGLGLILVTVTGFTGAAALAYQLWNDHFQ